MSATHAGPTILIVEDCADDLELLRIAMKNMLLLWQLRFVEDGEAAIGYLTGAERFADRNANPFPELVLLDIRLPKVDGFQVLEWIRTMPECNSLKVFVWTGSEHPNYPDQAKQLGALGFFMKGGLARLRELVICMNSAVTGGAEGNFGSADEAAAVPVSHG